MAAWFFLPDSCRMHSRLFAALLRSKDPGQLSDRTSEILARVVTGVPWSLCCF